MSKLKKAQLGKSVGDNTIARKVMPLSNQQIRENVIKTDAQRRRDAEYERSVIAERTRAREAKGSVQNHDFNIGEKLRMFPNSVGGIGQMFDDYINPNKIIGDLASNIGNSRTPGELAGNLALVAGIGATGFDPLTQGDKVMKGLAKGAAKVPRKVLNAVDRYSEVGDKLARLQKEGVKKGMSDYEIRQMQMERVGITSSQREAYVPVMSDFLDKYVTPYGYTGYNGETKLTQIINNIKSGNRKKDLAHFDAHNLAQRDDAWKLYLGKPQSNNTFRLANTAPVNHPSYTPEQLKNMDIYSINNSMFDNDIIRTDGMSPKQHALLNGAPDVVPVNNIMGGFNRRANEWGLQYNDIWDLDVPIRPAGVIPRSMQQNKLAEKLLWDGERPRKIVVPIDKFIGKPFMSHEVMPHLNSDVIKYTMLKDIESNTGLPSQVIDDYRKSVLSNHKVSKGFIPPPTQEVTRGPIDWVDAVNKEANPGYGPINGRAYENQMKSPYVPPITGPGAPFLKKQAGGAIANNRKYGDGMISNWWNSLDFSAAEDASFQKEYDYLNNWYANRKQIQQDGVLTKIPKTTIAKMPSVTKQLDAAFALGSYNPSNNEIHIRKQTDSFGNESEFDPSNNTYLHELNHAYQQNMINPSLYRKAPTDVTMKNKILWDKYSNNKEDAQYLYTPDEVHSRLMQFRFRNNIQPGQFFKPEDIKNFKDKKQLGQYTDEEITKLLNETVSTNSKVTNKAKVGGNVSNTGYLPDSPDRFNSFNIIPSDTITMDTVPHDVLAIADNGQTKLMKKNSGLHKFKGANTVAEIPMYFIGGSIPNDLMLKQVQMDEGGPIFPMGYYPVVGDSIQPKIDWRQRDLDAINGKRKNEAYTKQQLDSIANGFNRQNWEHQVNNAGYVPLNNTPKPVRDTRIVKQKQLGGPMTAAITTAGMGMIGNALQSNQSRDVNNMLRQKGNSDNMFQTYQPTMKRGYIDQNSGMVGLDNQTITQFANLPVPGYYGSPMMPIMADGGLPDMMMAPMQSINGIVDAGMPRIPESMYAAPAPAPSVATSRATPSLSSDFSNYAEKAQKYISKVNPKTDITGEMLAKGAETAYKKYGKVVPVELALAQLQEEGYLAKTTIYNKPQRTRNPFNVGNTDDGTVKVYDGLQPAVNSYFNLIARSYLKNKSPEDLLSNFTNSRGERYASGKNYEAALVKHINKINKLTAYKEGGEYDLSDQEIKRLRDMGYEVEVSQ